MADNIAPCGCLYTLGTEYSSRGEGPVKVVVVDLYARCPRHIGKSELIVSSDIAHDLATTRAADRQTP